ncbi:MAG: tetratricopeptide repeat protein [Planctomycetes bacterium]|nr:tetratricopeptide repeat protein [Planctomycetota bacterium]NBY03760.1 tetratricopeptide repeat protein [Planctomycetota bacterium]
MKNSSKPLVNKALGELFSSHLKQQINLFEQGLGAPSYSETAIPHGTLSDVGIDPVSAWKDAVFPTLNKAKGAITNISAPPGWQSLLFSLPALFAIPFASGHFPQAIRNPIELPKFIQEEAGWQTLLPLPELEGWSKGNVQKQLISLGICRLAGRHDQASTLLNLAKDHLSSDIIQNELGANFWAMGDHDQALQAWEKLGEQSFAFFNRGLAHLKLGREKSAFEQLQKASELIPTSSGWHHLAMLYQNS